MVSPCSLHAKVQPTSPQSSHLTNKRRKMQQDPAEIRAAIEKNKNVLQDIELMINSVRTLTTQLAPEHCVQCIQGTRHHPSCPTSDANLTSGAPTRSYSCMTYGLRSTTSSTYSRVAQVSISKRRVRAPSFVVQERSLSNSIVFLISPYLSSLTLEPESGASFREHAKFTYTALECLAKLALSSDGNTDSHLTRKQDDNRHPPLTLLSGISRHNSCIERDTGTGVAQASRTITSVSHGSSG